MPRLFAEIARSKGHTIDVDQATGEGASLAWHLLNKETKRKIAEGKWTHVVLQERSRGPLEDKASMFRHARLLNDLVRDERAQTVFYMTWAGRDKPTDQSRISAAYEKIAGECGAVLAPVGKAWELLRDRYPDFELYHKDGRHAGKTGAYLSACVFYTLILKDSPVGLPGRIDDDDRRIMDLLTQDAIRLQQAAFDAVNDYQDRR